MFGASRVRTQDSLTAPTLRLARRDDGRPVMHFVDLGPPSPGVEIRIAKNGGSEQVGELQVGHLQIRAPCVMAGYHDNPSANAECYPGDGWFDSGDLGFICGGRLALTGRAKEMVRALIDVHLPSSSHPEHAS